MNKEITHIRIQFQGTAKGKRKIDFQSEKVAQIDGHTLLSADQFIDCERKAWQLLDEKAYRNVSKAELVTNFGWDKGEHIISMELMPKQRIAVMR